MIFRCGICNRTDLGCEPGQCTLKLAVEKDSWLGGPYVPETGQKTRHYGELARRALALLSRSQSTPVAPEPDLLAFMRRFHELLDGYRPSPNAHVNAQEGAVDAILGVKSSLAHTLKEFEVVAAPAEEEPQAEPARLDRETVERVARAIASARHGGKHDPDHEIVCEGGVREPFWKFFQDEARAAIAALSGEPDAPAGDRP